MSSTVKRAAGFLAVAIVVIIGFARFESTDNKLADQDYDLKQTIAAINELRKDQRSDSKNTAVAICQSQNGIKLILANLLKQSTANAQAEGETLSAREEGLLQDFLTQLKPDKCKKLPVAQPTNGTHTGPNG